MGRLARRWWGEGRTTLVRERKRATVRVEPLEGRVLLSYLVIPRGEKAFPVHTGDARVHEPLYSNGLAVKHALNFYPHYTGPRRPELNGVRASAFASGTNLVFSGTVAAPIVTKPKTRAEESIYTFALDRGGASKTGPFPGRPRIRFDGVVVVEFRQKAPTVYVQLTDPKTKQPGTPKTSLPASSLVVNGDTLTVTVPLAKLPSSGHAFNQWNVNFFTRNPNQPDTFRGVASLTPEYTMFQVNAVPPPVI
jgi:hypothetical protein